MTPDEIQAFRLEALTEVTTVAREQKLRAPSGMRTGVTLDVPTLNLSFDTEVDAAEWVEFFALDSCIVWQHALSGRTVRHVTGSGLWRGWHLEVNGWSELADAATELIPAVADA